MLDGGDTEELEFYTVSRRRKTRFLLEEATLVREAGGSVNLGLDLKF
jgi:hypothetical protein